MRRVWRLAVVDKCWSLCCSSGFQYILWHIRECHLGRPFNDMFYCTTIISLIRSTKQTLYVMKIPFPLSCVPVSPSTSIHRWMPVPASRSLSPPCLSLVERRNQGCSEAPGTKTLVHGHAREVRGGEKVSSSSNSSGTSSISLPEVEERAGARKSGKWRGVLSVVGFCHLRSTRKWKPIKAECHSMPQALTSSQVSAFYWSHK